jgi:CheY-like chemotaxis protein
MDGYETMQRIRGDAPLAHIPLIAVTAKAMKGDRQKCLDAGASDYIAKPVDIDLLLALLRVWIGRSKAGADSVRASDVSNAA